MGFSIWTNKTNKIKEMKGQDWIVLILLGVLLLIVAIPTGSTLQKKSSGNTFGTTGSSSSSYESDNRDEYICATEKKLKEILGQMQGVGKVDVMITLKDSSGMMGSDTVEGVVVIAEGGADVKVVSEITETVSALFNIEVYKVKVFPMKETNTIEHSQS